MEIKKFNSDDNKVYTQEEFLEEFKDSESEKKLIKKYEELPVAVIGYDSSIDTLKHMKRVNELLIMLTKEILDRATTHDASKLSTQEKELFDKYTPRLKEVKFVNDQEGYEKQKEDLADALEHHNQINRHHPEYHKQGIEDMNLVDIIEMIVDWKAASERQPDGNVLNSIDKLKERFKITKQLVNILKNTVRDYLQ